ncbi:hypothetical protein [Mesorhizobium sp. NPDC059025]|uniref:hypothetical protein n=1 Tax=unclassified Mesorhizobium TaxID=325217 RepID=UPI0036CA35CA
MTPRQFLETVCKPNVKALAAAHDDFRLAVNAILSLDAVVGVLHARLKKAGARVEDEDRDFRNVAATAIPKYELLRDAAFSLKHGTLKGRARLVSNHQQVVLAGVPFGAFAFGQDTFGGKTIFIEKNDGTSERVADVATIVLRELELHFASYGE